MWHSKLDRMLDKCDEIFTKDSQLFERVLAVDFHQDLPRDAPVSHENMQKRIKWHEPLQKLPASIPDLRSYHRIFFPLYMIECLQMLLSHKYKSMNYPTRVNLVSALDKVFYMVIRNCKQAACSC